MRKIVFYSIIALSAMVVSCSKTTQETEEKLEISKPASQEISAIRTANELAKYGYEVESATALIEAANILVGIPTQSVEEAANIEGEETVKKESDKSLNPASILASAKEFAAEDEILLALAARVEKKLLAKAEGTRGAMGGPKYDLSTVRAKSYTTYTQKFWADELAEVAVSGDGDTDLDLYVYDQNGNLIVSDTDYSDDCYVRFVPRWTGAFRIKIVNRGNVYNNFALVTN